MTLAEAIVYGMTALIVAVFAFDAARSPCWRGHKSWRWRKGCDECVEMMARRWRG